MKTDRSADFEGARCPAPEDAVAAALGVDAPAAAESIIRHAQSCARCRALLDETADTARILKKARPEPLDRDLVEGILARIPERAWENRSTTKAAHRDFLSFPLWTPLRIAALFMILAGAALIFLRSGNDGPENTATSAGDIAAVDKGVEWLLSGQLPSGGWDVEKLGGKPEYTAALNGLAALALARSDLSVSDLRHPLERAATFLLKLQAEDGRFGDDVEGTMYNQGMATLALLEAYCVTGDAELRAPIEKALSFIRGRQALSGGWGYRRDENAQPNTSITAWQVQALLLADALGWHENRISVRKALAWMSGTVNGSGYFGYERTQQFPEGPETLTMMGAHCLLAARRLDIPVDPELVARVTRGMGRLAGEKPDDYYRAYFYSSALSEADPETFGNALAAARSTVAARQQVGGSDAGAWSADDRWGSAGGRVYSTSMALLALLSPHEHHTAF